MDSLIPVNECVRSLLTGAYRQRGTFSEHKFEGRQEKVHGSTCMLRVRSDLAAQVIIREAFFTIDVYTQS